MLSQLPSSVRTPLQPAVPLADDRRVRRRTKAVRGDLPSDYTLDGGSSRHPGMPTLLETHGLEKHCRMGDTLVRALDGVSMTVAQGEFVGLLGTSGSGKSTLLNLIAGLDKATSGSLRIFDQDLAAMKSEELSIHRRKNVGIIFQSFNLVTTMSAVENV